MIEIDNIFAGYGKREVLHGVSFFVPAGKITTLIGENGSGKSTLLKTLLHFLPLTSGRILVEGVPIDKFSRSDLAKKIAYLPQSKTVPDLTAQRLVLQGRFPYLSYPRKYRKEDIMIAEKAMAQMGILEFSGQPMAELSGGIKQKVYIAMALAQQAKVIVMDEPTTYLDVGQQVKFSKLVRQLSEDGKTLFLVLHDLPLALRLSDQVVALCNGKILGAGTPAQILESEVIQTLYGVRVRSVELTSGVQYFYDL